MKPANLDPGLNTASHVKDKLFENEMLMRKS